MEIFGSFLCANEISSFCERKGFEDAETRRLSFSRMVKNMFEAKEVRGTRPMNSMTTHGLHGKMASLLLEDVSVPIRTDHRD